MDKMTEPKEYKKNGVESVPRCYNHLQAFVMHIFPRKLVGKLVDRTKRTKWQNERSKATERCLLLLLNEAQSLLYHETNEFRRFRIPSDVDGSLCEQKLQQHLGSRWFVKFNFISRELAIDRVKEDRDDREKKNVMVAKKDTIDEELREIMCVIYYW